MSNDSLCSESLDKLAEALSKAQGEIKSANKDKTNPHFKSQYASLDSVWESCREPLSKNGLSVIQQFQSLGDQLVISTMLVHSSGQWIKSIMPVISAKSGIQAMGAAITYCRRYSLSALVGICPDEDDDGNSADDPENKTRKPSKPVPFVNPETQENFEKDLNEFALTNLKYKKSDIRDCIVAISENSKLKPYDTLRKASADPDKFFSYLINWLEKRELDRYRENQHKLADEMFQ